MLLIVSSRFSRHDHVSNFGGREVQVVPEPHVNLSVVLGPLVRAADKAGVVVECGVPRVKVPRHLGNVLVRVAAKETKIAAAGVRNYGRFCKRRNKRRLGLTTITVHTAKGTNDICSNA
jgi:hypothetical protein